MRYTLLFVLSLAFGLAHGELDFHVSYVSGFGPYAGTVSCGEMPAEQVDALKAEQADWLAGTNRSQLKAGGETADRGMLVPSDYVNPLTHVMEGGVLAHDLRVGVSRQAGRVKFEQVFSFDAPDWARYALVLFEPDEDNHPNAWPGLFLRPDRPFVGGDWPHISTFDRPEPIERHAYVQAAYRSTHSLHHQLTEPRLAVPQFVLMHEDMDPAPAGRQWHVALGQLQGLFDPHDEQVSGRLRVWFSDSDYRPPLAIQFFFDPEDDPVGFFDETPRVVDGDNPHTTIGEAKRWVLYRAAEELLDELDFTAPFPIAVDMRTFHRSEHSAAGWAQSSARLPVHHGVPMPGRLLARRGTGAVSANAPTALRVPGPALEREAGTDGCRVLTLDGQAMCSASIFRPPVIFPDLLSGGGGLIGVLRDYELDSGDWFRWDLNQHDRPMFGRGPEIKTLFQHELGHVLGATRSGFDSHAYVTTFDPPRSVRERPADPTEAERQLWDNTVTKRVFIGPHAAVSPHNPWRDTIEPGPRIRDVPGDRDHYMRASGDHLAQWDDAPGAGGIMRSVTGADRRMGITRDVLLDFGFATRTLAVRERRLPRHLFDPDRSGHGIDLRRVERPDGTMAHFLHFYTYDANGDPEWYMAVGEVDDEMVLEADLDYITYDVQRAPPMQADSSRQGTIRLDLDPPLDHPTCQARRDPNDIANLLEITHVVVDWAIDGESGSWCMQPLRFGDLQPFPVDVSGSWFPSDPAEVGWGLSINNRHIGPRPILNTILYYYGADGLPTWAWGVVGATGDLAYGSVQSGVEIEMLHFEGFCRSCPPILVQGQVAGFIRLNLNDPVMAPGGANLIEAMEITNHGPGGGTWNRSHIPLMLLSSPHPNMGQ